VVSNFGKSVNVSEYINSITLQVLDLIDRAVIPDFELISELAFSYRVPERERFRNRLGLLRGTIFSVGLTGRDCQDRRRIETNE
jgi:hypothetical protein